MLLYTAKNVCAQCTMTTLDLTSVHAKMMQHQTPEKLGSHGYKFPCKLLNTLPHSSSCKWTETCKGRAWLWWMTHQVSATETEHTQCDSWLKKAAVNRGWQELFWWLLLCYHTIMTQGYKLIHGHVIKVKRKKINGTLASFRAYIILCGNATQMLLLLKNFLVMWLQLEDRPPPQKSSQNVALAQNADNPAGNVAKEAFNLTLIVLADCDMECWSLHNSDKLKSWTSCYVIT